MHFIEQIFDLSPDGGSGVLEFWLFAIPIIIAGLALWWRSGSRHTDERR